MKKQFTLLATVAFVLLLQPASAQDSSHNGALTKINSTSATSDQLTGKKIQQQSLSNKKVESLHAVTDTGLHQPKKKTRAKHPHKNS